MRIDKTLMPKASGSQQSGMLSALRFLQLIDDSGRPKDHFKSVALADDDSRKAPLNKVFRDSYGFLFDDPEFDLIHASSGQVTEKFKTWGISGSTLTKTIAFFLSAAKEYGIPVSPHVKAPTAPKNTNGNPKGKKSKVSLDDAQNTGKLTETADDLDPGLEVFSIPLPGKPPAKIIVPIGLDADDWAMLQTMLAAYVKRWKGFAPEGKE
ncbi:hypothetical protein PBS_05200 [Paraburkholderia sp. 2C]